MLLHMEILRVFLDLEVVKHDMEKVKELTFIGVESLNLDIEDGLWVKGDTISFLNVFSKLLLVLVFDVHNSLLDVFVSVELFEVFKLLWMFDPLVADFLGDDVRKFFVAV